MILTVGTSIKDSKGNLYILDDIIGHGNFGYVFKTHREKDHAIFALKTMLPSFGDVSLEKSFKNEIQLATGVCGEHIIHYEYIHDGDTFLEYPPYIIMEYADGGTLGDELKARKQTNELFGSDELLDILKQLADGMRQVNASLVHRDIKPDNILRCGHTLKISDFGLSKVAAENTRTLSFKGGGTPLYMAPEAWDFSKNTIQMDIYSMGVIFYELATLHYPYDPLPSTHEECRSAHLYSPITSPTKIRPSLSPSIVSLINRMLEKSIKRRFSTWDEIIKLLETQTTSKPSANGLVASAVAAQNAKDAARQKQESAARQRQKEKEDFLKLVFAQIKQTIVMPIAEFTEEVNQQYAGKDKLRFAGDMCPQADKTSFHWELTIPPDNALAINMEAIWKENFTRVVPRDILFDDFGRNRTREENYIPQFRRRNILAWGEIVNRAGYGFNVLLLDSGDIYGDWIIMNNKNSFSHGTNKERREPFAFSLHELPKEINNVQMTHLYSADFEDFKDTTFLGLINTLAYVFTKS